MYASMYVRMYVYTHIGSAGYIAPLEQKPRLHGRLRARRKLGRSKSYVGGMPATSILAAYWVMLRKKGGTGRGQGKSPIMMPALTIHIGMPAIINRRSRDRSEIMHTKT